MSDIPEWLTDEAIERTMTLGRETMVFLKRHEPAKALDPHARVEPHPELLAAVETVKSRYKRQDAPIGSAPT